MIGKSAVGSDEIQLRIDPIHADLDQEISGIHRKITQLKGVKPYFLHSFSIC